jgi:Sap-like sulfolipid-1-addressing protein
MWHVFGGILPLALAAAVSSMPIVAVSVILISPRRGESALPFLAGWVLGCVTVLVIGTLVAQAIPVKHRRHPETTIAVLEILIGLALVGLGLFALGKRSEGGTGPLPNWVDKIDTFGSLPALGVGLALNLRPKALLLAAAASLVLRGGKLGAAESLVMIAVYTAIATSTVSVPTVMTLLFPERMEPRLNAAREWLTRNGLLITAVVMILIGVVVAVIGVANL